MREIKSESSSWIHKELQMHGFGWQEGYGAFTVGASSIDRVRTYVLQQQEHHRTTTFQQEYVAMLKTRSGRVGRAISVAAGARACRFSRSCRSAPLLLAEDPVVPLRFTTGYQLSSLQLDK